MMRAFRLVSTRLESIPTDAASFDELTRQLPRGFYSTFITNHSGMRVLGLTAHLERLYLPARGVSPSATRADLRLALSKLASDSAPSESRFRVVLGVSDGTVYVIVQPFLSLPKEVFERGVKVVTAELTRRDPRLKDSGFIAESRAERQRVGEEIFEVLLTRGGRIYEGMTSNFYAVLATRPSTAERRTRPSAQDGDFHHSTALSGATASRERSRRADGTTLVTARTGILLGVTRRAVLGLARGQGMSILYRALRVDEEFAEAFLTSSSRGVVPIISIDGRGVGEGRPGAWTKVLSLAYQAYVEERSERFVE